MSISTLFLFFIVLAIIALWFFTDPRPLRKRLTKEYIRVIVFVIAVVLPQFFIAKLFPWPDITTSLHVKMLGLGILLSGCALSVWTKYTMRELWGPPGQHDISRQTKLITDGPFSITRNPIYIGITLVFFGFSLAIGSYGAPLIFLLTGYFVKEAIVEEKLLHKHFGENYDDYKKRVPRFLRIGKFSF